MSKSLKHIERRLISHIPDFLFSLGKVFPFYIAGGAITSLVTNSEINDLDIYVKKKSDVFALCSLLINQCNIISVTNKSLLLQHREQKINVVFLDGYGTPEDIFNSFDFTCVMGAYDVSTSKFHFHNDFFIHNAQRVIGYNPNTRFPIMSLLRIKKYADRGYHVSKNEMLRIILSCCNLNISNYEELGEQIGGMYGLELDEIVDTTKDFDFVSVIKAIDDLSIDYDKHIKSIDSQPIMKGYYYDKLLEVALKDPEYKVKRTAFKSFTNNGTCTTSEYLVIDNKLFGFSDCNNADAYDKLDIQLLDVIAYARFSTWNNEMDFCGARIKKDIEIGSKILDNITNDRKGPFIVKCFDSSDLKTFSNQFAQFNVPVTKCMKFNNGQLYYEDLTFAGFVRFKVKPEKAAEHTPKLAFFDDELPF